MLSFRANFVWTVGGNGVHALSRWMALAVLAKLTPTSDVGLYALGTAIALPTFTIAGMNLRAIQATDVKGEFSFPQYLASRLFGIFVSLVASAIWATLGGYGPRALMVILAAVLIQSFESLSDITYGYFQQIERMDVSAKSMGIRGPLRLLALTVAAKLTHDVVWAAFSEAAILVFVAFTFDLRQVSILGEKNGSRMLLPQWRWRVQKRLFIMAAPMMGLVAIVAIQGYLPRHLLERFAGTRELGIFAVLSSLASLPSPLLSALGQAASPRLARRWTASSNAGDKFSPLLLKLLGIAFAISGAGLIFSLLLGERALRLLYTPEYASSATLLVWLMAANVVGTLSNTMGTAITATRAFTASFRAQFVSFLVSLPIQVYLAKKWMGYGVAIAGGIQAALALFIFSWVLVQAKRTRLQDLSASSETA